MQRREHFIADRIIRSGNEDKSDLICEIFGINKTDKKLMGTKNVKLLSVEQVKPTNSNAPWFVTMPDYTDDVKQELINFLVLIFMCMIDEGDELSEF